MTSGRTWRTYFKVSHKSIYPTTPTRPWLMAATRRFNSPEFPGTAQGTNSALSRDQRKPSDRVAGTQCNKPLASLGTVSVKGFHCTESICYKTTLSGCYTRQEGNNGDLSHKSGNRDEEKRMYLKTNLRKSTGLVTKEITVMKKKVHSNSPISTLRVRVDDSAIKW